MVAAHTDVLQKANTWLIDSGNRIMDVFGELATDSLLNWKSVWQEPVQFENTCLIDSGKRIMDVFGELATDSLQNWNSVWLEPVQFENVDMDELMKDMVNAVFGLYHPESSNSAAMNCIFSLCSLSRIALYEEFRAQHIVV